MNAKTAFYKHLNKVFYPKIIDLGFKGRDQLFRRVRGELVDVINIQDALQDANCCIKLGLHISFFPVVWSSLKFVDPNKLRVDDCEYQKYLAPDNQSEYWWFFDGGGSGGSPDASVSHIIDTYLNIGEPSFQQFQNIQDLLNALTDNKIKENEVFEVFGEVFPARAALIASRIYKHLGDNSRASEQAKIGISKLGHTVEARNELEELAELK